MNGVHGWADLLIRWFHVIAGIAWIGSSFYFVWLDSSLEKGPDDDTSDVEGHLWMVHSGGFYRVEKKKLVPSTMPETLHWFKWEAGLTFLSGFTLLIVVYYLSGGALLVDSSVSDISVWGARLLGLSTLILSWVIYDLLWISPIGQNTKVGGLVSFAGLIGIAFLLSNYLSGRAAYMHVGATMGTLMVANVWMRILPAQRSLIAATTSGGNPDAKLAKRAKQRSMHNNYMTLPVVFVMISNHYYGTYGHEYNWLILALIFIAGAGAQHLRNQTEHGAKWSRAILITVVTALCALFYLTADHSNENEEAPAPAVSKQDKTKSPPSTENGPKSGQTTSKGATLPGKSNSNTLNDKSETNGADPASDSENGTRDTPGQEKSPKGTASEDGKMDPPSSDKNTALIGTGLLEGTIRFLGKVEPAKEVSLAPGCTKSGSNKARLQSIEAGEKGHLKNVFVHITGGLENHPKGNVPSDPVIIDQKGCIYEPHVLGIRRGQVLEMKNSDPIMHNVRSVSKRNGFNLAMPTQNMRIKRKFKKAETMVRLKCDIHPWMSAFVGVVDHPFFAVTDSDGFFTLRGLPAGTYTIEAWHETLGKRTQSVTVNAGAATTTTLVYKKE